MSVPAATWQRDLEKFHSPDGGKPSQNSIELVSEAVNLSTQNWGDILGSWGPVKHRRRVHWEIPWFQKIHMKKKQLVALLILKHQGMWKANWTWKLAAKTCASSSPLAQAHALLKGIGRKWSPRLQLVIFFLSLLGFVFPCFVLGLGFRGLEIFGRPFFSEYFGFK